MVFGLTRKSKYVELEKQNDELKAYMNVLTAEMGTLRREVAQLKMDMTASKVGLGGSAKPNTKQTIKHSCNKDFS